MRIAAIDCGSNSFHLLIADTLGHDQLVVVQEDKTLLYLGAEVASLGHISPESLLRARRVVRHYRNLISHHDVDEVRAVATSAIRSATNGDEVIDALSRTLHENIRVISGEEEAETIFRAISAVSALPESRILACDMGGGSLEVMAGQRHGLEHATSVGLGASRVARELNVHDPLEKQDIEAIERKCTNLLKDFHEQYPADLFSHVVASSGTLTTLITMARAKVDGHVSPPLSTISATREEIESIVDDLINLDSKQRSTLLGYDSARDEFLPTAAVITRYILSLVTRDAVWLVSPYALREGLVLLAGDRDDVDAADQPAVANNTVEELEHRMSLFTPTKQSRYHIHHPVDLVSHGHYTEKLATSLFDQSAQLHALGNENRKLLGYAARLHDIGATINYSKYDQHGAYILSSIPLVGFSPEDATLIRGLVRWHRKRNPRPSDRFVGRMSEKELHRAIWLTALLRIANGADAGSAESIDDIAMSIKPDVIYIRFVSHHDCELEVYSARKARGLLEEVSGRDVVIVSELASHQQEQD